MDTETLMAHPMEDEFSRYIRSDETPGLYISHYYMETPNLDSFHGDKLYLAGLRCSPQVSGSLIDEIHSTFAFPFWVHTSGEVIGLYPNKESTYKGFETLTVDCLEARGHKSEVPSDFDFYIPPFIRKSKMDGSLHNLHKRVRGIDDSDMSKVTDYYSQAFLDEAGI